DVEAELESYMHQHEIDSTWPAAERIIVCVDELPLSRHLIRRAWRMAGRRQSELSAVFVETPRWATASPEARRELEENLRRAEDLGVEVIRVQASDVAEALIRLAHERNVDSIVIGHSHHGRLYELFHGSIVRKLLRLARDVDVHLVAERDL